MARISTSSTGGNVNIQDTNGNPITATDGSLNVNVTGTGTSGTPISSYNEITSVAINATVTVLTYTVPSNQSLTLARVLISSDSISTIQLEIDGITNAKARFSYTLYNIDLAYGSYVLPSGTVITVVATNNSPQGTASFNATLQGALN
jgi:hypothetical protein